MARKISQAELIAAIQAALNPPGQEINLASSADNTEGWDSLGHLNILLELEGTLGVPISEMPEVAAARSVIQLVGILKKNDFV